MECCVCSRVVFSGKYCAHHDQCLTALHEHHKIWNEAFTSVSWHDFLKRLQDKVETGDWVKQVIEVELKQLESKGKA